MPVMRSVMRYGLFQWAKGLWRLGLSVGLPMACAAADVTLVARGADPFGTKDSWAALQEALDLGGSVVVPPGTYLVSKTLRITRSGTSVLGQPQTVFRFASGFTGSGIVAQAEPFTLKDIVIRDVKVVGDRGSYTPGHDGEFACGITCRGVDGADVENCSVEWFTFSGVNIAASRNVRVSRCNTRGGRHGITVNGHIGNPHEQGKPYGCRSVSITDCSVKETWDTFIAVGLCASDVGIQGCSCEGSAAHGIDVFNSERVTVSGNRLRNWMNPQVVGNQARQAVGLFIHSDWGVSVELPTRDIVAVGNTLLYDADGGGGVRPVGISVAGNVDGAVIAGNIVKGGETGMAVTDIEAKGARLSPRNVSVTGNVFTGQRLTLWLESLGPMGVSLSQNRFDPAGGGSLGHFGEKTEGVTCENNTVVKGALPSMPPGIVWSGAGVPSSSRRD